MPLSRRHLIMTTAAAGLWASAGPAAAYSQDIVVPELDAASDADQTEALQAAIERAAETSGHLFIPAGRYRTRALTVPSNIEIAGVMGASILQHLGNEPLIAIADRANVVLSGLLIDGGAQGGETWHGGTIHVTGSTNIVVRDCGVTNTQLNGISMLNSSGLIENCTIATSAYTAIFLLDASATRITGNRISDCGNGGIRVWRSEQGHDGTIVSDNTISAIDWQDGGNGQNGNGINIFRADDVIVANNMISDCTFSAIRLNATNNTQITGNTCLNSLEVAVYSEFAFTGSIIADNIIDGAAGGISITNFNDGGRLATCTGNIVRNLTAGSSTNPDLVRPYGIAAEADAVIANNVVENVAGTGIAAGWGPYLRDVTISNNLVRDIDIGIGVSVAPQAGAAIISSNTISGARQHAIAGSAWQDLIAPDLANQSQAFPQLAISNNTVL